MRFGYFLKMLPSRMSTFIHREIAWLRSQGHEVYLFPVWDIDPNDLPETITGSPDYIIARTSLVSLGWVPALARFSLTSPLRVARIVAGYRRLYGIAFVLKSIEAARLIQRKRIERICAHTLSLAASRARICWLLTEIPYSITVHGSDLLLFPPPGRPGINPGCTRRHHPHGI